MKNRKKYILVVATLLIVIALLIITKNKKEFDINKNTNLYGFNSINIDWNEIVNVEIDGAEGHSNVVLTYNEISELDNRVDEVINSWESKRTQVDLNTEEAQKEYELVSKLTAYKEIQWCTLPDNWNTLSNGDELVITCGNEILKELGYEYEDTLTITVDNLDKTLLVEPINNNLSSDVRDSDNYKDNDEPIQSNESSETIMEKEVINNDTYYSLGDDVFVYPNDLNNFDLENEDGKRYFIYVDTQTDFQKAKAYASENNNIDYIQIGNQIFSKENNFEEGEE